MKHLLYLNKTLFNNWMKHLIRFWNYLANTCLIEQSGNFWKPFDVCRISGQWLSCLAEGGDNNMVIECTGSVLVIECTRVCIVFCLFVCFVNCCIKLNKYIFNNNKKGTGVKNMSTYKTTDQFIPPPPLNFQFAWGWVLVFIRM